ncbi:hypothetical protein DX03_08505 [Stenotrophomonas rhizophila]|nr:hypothetical protein DX03_08505 [Stenotrophomonas rhizophila]
MTAGRSAVLLVALAAAGAANAASAVFYDTTTGVYGYSMNQRTVSAAVQQALGYCVQRSPNCASQASTTAPGFSAVYTGTRAVGFALSEKEDGAAQRKAEAMCRRQARDCVLALVWRETPPLTPDASAQAAVLQQRAASTAAAVAAANAAAAAETAAKAAAASRSTE